MKYIKNKKYNSELYSSKFMGPNPLKLLEELMLKSKTPTGATVMDLGSGQGVTSVFLAKEYGFRVFATDLWSDPTDNKRFFDSVGVSDREIIPIKADANELPYSQEFFDAVVCTDSYNYFGRDKTFLEEKILPYIKHGGYFYAVVPGMKHDCHDNLPPELLLSWDEEQLDYIHDAEYWKSIIGCTDKAEIAVIGEMQSNDEVWADWICCDNDYAQGDKKAIDAGACKYMNFIEIVVRKL